MVPFVSLGVLPSARKLHLIGEGEQAYSGRSLLKASFEVCLSIVTLEAESCSFSPFSAYCLARSNMEANEPILLLGRESLRALREIE